jgi:hypothetical protein
MAIRDEAATGQSIHATERGYKGQNARCRVKRDLHVRRPGSSGPPAKYLASRSAATPRLHQLLHDPAQRLAQKVSLRARAVANDLLARHPLPLGYRDDSSRRCPGGFDEFEHRGSRASYRAPSDALLPHATGRDPTASSPKPVTCLMPCASCAPVSRQDSGPRWTSRPSGLADA